MNDRHIPIGPFRYFCGPSIPEGGYSPRELKHDSHRGFVHSLENVGKLHESQMPLAQCTARLKAYVGVEEDDTALQRSGGYLDEVMVAASRSEVRTVISVREEPVRALSEERSNLPNVAIPSGETRG